MSLNKILLIGNLGSDPEIRYTPAKKPIASFGLATNRRYRIEGQIHEETEWFRIVAFGRMAEICSEYLKKGKSIFIEGRIRTRSWIDAGGMKHYRTEVIAEALTMIGKRNGDSPAAVPTGAEAVEDSEPF
jgi:single-strand DNA-binding protein